MSNQNILNLVAYIRSCERYHKTKKKREEAHSKLRILERYKVLDSESLVPKLIQDVKTNRAILLQKQSNTRRLYYSDGFFFIYSKKTHNIVTFLKKDWVTHRSDPEALNKALEMMGTTSTFGGIAEMD